MARADIDQSALRSELRGMLQRQGASAMRPVAELLTEEATSIARRNFRHSGEGVRSIHYEFFIGISRLPEYRVSYDGEEHSYMGLWEAGTRRFAPRPYLRPAAAAVQRQIR